MAGIYLCQFPTSDESISCVPDIQLTAAAEQPFAPHGCRLCSLKIHKKTESEDLKYEAVPYTGKILNFFSVFSQFLISQSGKTEKMTLFSQFSQSVNF